MSPENTLKSVSGIPEHGKAPDRSTYTGFRAPEDLSSDSERGSIPGEAAILAQLRRDFGDDFSRGAFCIDANGEAAIVGKFGRITQHPCGAYDAWFVGKDLEPLSERKITFIARECPADWKLRRVDGEAWVYGTDREFVLQAAELLGVRQKRRLSDTQRAAMTARLRRAA